MADELRALAPLIARLTFGSPDLCTVHLGSILGNRSPTYRSPIPRFAPCTLTMPQNPLLPRENR
jgi:hypothetical protein